MLKTKALGNSGEKIGNPPRSDWLYLLISNIEGGRAIELRFFPKPPRNEQSKFPLFLTAGGLNISLKMLLSIPKLANAALD